MKNIIVAMPSESKYLVNYLGLKRIDNYYRNENFQLFEVGIGVSNVIKNLSKIIKLGLIDNNDSIINIGYAGAKGIDIGNIIQVSECCRFKPSHTIEEESCFLNTLYKELECAKCFTNDDFVEKDDDHDKAVYDMELYYICRFFERQISSLKIISDNLNYHVYESFDSDIYWKRVIELLNK